MGARCLVQLLLAVTWWAASWSSASSHIPEHTFQILHEQSSKCLKVEDDQLKVGQCSESSDTLWTWGSGRRLFSLGSQKCLGLDLAKPQDPLKLFPCDSNVRVWWRCESGLLYGASRYELTVRTEVVVATFQSNDTWKWYNTTEDICEVPYYVVYTKGGNSFGKPCEFPFLYDHNWYHDCIYNATEDQEWCATSRDFDTDGNWGSCLKPVLGCNGTWAENSNLTACYQFSGKSTLTWKEAYMSCQSQGAELLSIASIEELKYIIETAELPDSIWIGLNRLETGAGWQWSDHSPLNFINWDMHITGFSVLDSASCGKLNVNTGQWDGFPCEASLPYICKKKLNGSEADSYDQSDWQYSETECAANWTAYNGYCYVLQQPDTWQEAENLCNKQNGSLISLHSLADIELVITQFQTENENIWSGFQSASIPTLFKWSDGTEAHFTYWDQNEPLPSTVMSNCVAFSGKSGRWHVRNCSETLISICKKPGLIKNDTETDTGCPDQNWSRHGEYCYLVDKKEVSFDERCNLTIRNKFEQEFLNAMVRKLRNLDGKYFWTSLQDLNRTGDYYWETGKRKEELSYSNWNTHEPVIAGGCVAMATGESLGKWEVKSCKNFKAFSICKKRIGEEKEEEKEEVPKPVPTTCPEGWQPGSDLHCYKLFNKERLLKQRTWEEAEGICEEFGGHLVSFAHIQEMKNLILFLKSMVRDKRWLWVGLTKMNTEGRWQWSDDHPISSTIVDELGEDDYMFRDCVAIEINLPRPRTLWMWHPRITQEQEQEQYSLKPFHCDAQLEWVCQVPKGAPLKTPEWYQPEWKHKMGPPVVIDGSEYWFMQDTRLSHKQASLYCASNGSELATIETSAALTGIQNHLRQQGNYPVTAVMQRWWVKSTNYRSHREFMLQPMFFGDAADCSFVTPVPQFPDFIYRVNCNDKLPFICQNKNTSLLEIVTPKTNRSSGNCSVGWESFGNKCYLKVPDKYVNFSEANAYCQTFGGSLPSIANQLEQDFINYLSSGLKIKLWIGLTLTVNTAMNSWVDDTDVTYTNFNPILQGRLKKFEYDPFSKDKSKQCVFLLNNPNSLYVGTWDFTSCSDLQYVEICQKYIDKNESPSSPVVPEYLQFKGKNYTVIQKNMTWYSALVECKKRNMELVSITDQYELSFLGITIYQIGRPIWIGLSSSDDGIHYRWQDGSIVRINRWSEQDEETGECVFMDVDGKWKTEYCDIELPGAICHTPQTQPEKKQENTVACPHRIQDTVWFPFRNNCYAFLLTHKRWLYSETQYICHSLHPDAYVLSIRNEDENTFVVNTLQPYRDLAGWVWLGVVYDGNAKQLRWHDQTFVKFSNWRSGRPTVTNSSFYAAMELDGFWDMFLNPMDFQLLYLQQHSIVACKIEMGSARESVQPLPAYIPYSNFTYWVLKKQLTWFEAANECKQNDGHLASIGNENQQLFLEHIVRQDGFPLWIGLWNNYGAWSNPEWSDGTPLSYGTGEATRTMQSGNCVSLDTKGIWRLRNCTEALDGAICYTFSATSSKSESVGEVCPRTPGEGNWVRHNDFCYGFDARIYNYPVYTSEQANKLCQTLDPTSVLLTINDKEENAFVSRYLKDNSFVTKRVWLGVSLSDEKSSWLDGSPLQYSNWDTVQNGGSGSCAILSPDTGMWRKVPCTPELGRVVCKSPVRSSGVELAVGFAVFTILILLIGVVIYLYKKRSPFLFSSVRYRRAEDQMESMIDYS